MIKDLPSMERPRELLLKNGAEVLSNSQLLAILIGAGTAQRSAVNLAESIISMDNRGILFLNDCTPEELYTVNGIGPAKAAVLLAAVELGRRLNKTSSSEPVDASSPDRIADIFMSRMRYLTKEHFAVLMLNAKNQVIAEDEVSVGSLTSSPANPREVFSGALRRSAASVILVHNHPSGNPSPSREDVLITERLSKAGQILGIAVLDHIIIGNGTYISLREIGKMDF